MKHIACILVLALSSCAKSDLETHRELTRDMIAHRGAPDFVDASTNDYAAVRHSPSGMICVVPADGGFEFDVFPSSAPNAGAQCSSSDGDQVEAWIAVRFSTPTDLDAAFAQGRAQLNNGLESQVWRGRPGAADRASPEGLPHYRIARHEAMVGGEAQYLRLSMAEADGWYIQQIVSAPLADAESAEARAGERWRRGLRAFVEARVAPSAD